MGDFKGSLVPLLLKKSCGKSENVEVCTGINILLNQVFLAHQHTVHLEI